MDGFMVPLITGVGIVFVAVFVLMAVRGKMKKNQKELDKPPEVIEMEMQELIEKAKAEMVREGSASQEQGVNEDAEGKMDYWDKPGNDEKQQIRDDGSRSGEDVGQIDEVGQ